EVAERRIGPDGAVHVDAPEPRILAGVDRLRLADRGHHALRSTGIRHGIVAAELEVIAEREFHLLATLEVGGVNLEQARLGAHGVLLSPTRRLRAGADTTATFRARASRARLLVACNGQAAAKRETTTLMYERDDA